MSSGKAFYLFFFWLIRIRGIRVSYRPYSRLLLRSLSYSHRFRLSSFPVSLKFFRLLVDRKPVVLVSLASSSEIYSMYLIDDVFRGRSSPNYLEYMLKGAYELFL